MGQSSPSEEPLKQDVRAEAIRNWLSRHKISFETAAATLLSFMALILSIMALSVSVVQCNLSRHQTQLTEIQTRIAQNQWDKDMRRAAVEKSDHWQRLRDGIWEIIDLFPPGGFHLLEHLTPQQKAAWLQKIRTLLDAQTTNPVLIEDKICLGSWRNAISVARISADLTTDPTLPPNWTTSQAQSIHRDVFYVWEKLILDSDEISATGGRPPEAGK